MFYLHFWSKSGHLDRVPYPTVEEAIAAAWEFEAAEKLRITGSSENKYDGSFAGANRPKMTTVITDENNNDVELPQYIHDWFGRDGGSWRLKFLLWNFKHSSIKHYYMNEHHWADRFELASRGIKSVDDIVCEPDCDGCRLNLPEKLEKEPVPRARSLTRTEKILQLFSEGKSRQEIATEVGLSYARVCQIVRSSLT